uniref:TIGR00725 family protein n=1 Tax=Pararhizobium sp. IMCC3301 TaxID=3067904 RepID=UPI0027418AAF|nr:TIGR00725 family protein [Pararhizobium sp. IMCC3301]
MDRLSLHISDGNVFSSKGRLDPWMWTWRQTETPEDAVPASAEQALALVAASGNMRRIPVGVIGPRDASESQLATAEAIGAAVGRLGLTMICGGRGGVMEAASKGCMHSGGLTVGLLPDHEWHSANDFIALPIATGLSEARNMIIAKSCAVLIAVGGSYGTLSEIAYGLHFSKLVIGLDGAHEIEGLVVAQSAHEAMVRLAEHFMGSLVLSDN